MGQEDPLEKEIATHSSALAGEIPWTEEPGGYSPWGRQDLVTKLQVTFIEHYTDHYGVCIPSKRPWQGDQISVSINSERLKINRTGNGSLTQMRELSLSTLLQSCQCLLLKWQV